MNMQVHGYRTPRLVVPDCSLFETSNIRHILFCLLERHCLFVPSISCRCTGLVLRIKRTAGAVIEAVLRCNIQHTSRISADLIWTSFAYLVAESDENVMALCLADRVSMRTLVNTGVFVYSSSMPLTQLDSLRL